MTAYKTRKASNTAVLKERIKQIENGTPFMSHIEWFSVPESLSILCKNMLEKFSNISGKNVHESLFILQVVLLEHCFDFA